MTVFCFLGCGTLGSSIISGILDAQSSAENGNNGVNGESRNQFLACIKSDTSVARLKKLFGQNVTIYKNKNVEAVKKSQVVVLGCKPQGVQAILEDPEMQSALDGKLLVSICAGVKISQLQKYSGARCRCIRAMPNTPCQIRQAMTVISCDNATNDEDKELVGWIFETLGKTLFLEEKHQDAATALCGSGPAFVCVLLEAMADGGVMMGLPRSEAQLMAAQTMQGAARMVLEGNHPAVVRDKVATPGGCTIGGLLVMEDGKIRSTMARTIQEVCTQVFGDPQNVNNIVNYDSIQVRKCYEIEGKVENRLLHSLE